jgi:hypothetical protein
MGSLYTLVFAKVTVDKIITIATGIHETFIFTGSLCLVGMAFRIYNIIPSNGRKNR